MERGRIISFKKEGGDTIAVFWRTKSVRKWGIAVECFSLNEGHFEASIEYARGLKKSDDEEAIKIIKEYLAAMAAKYGMAGEL